MLTKENLRKRAEIENKTVQEYYDAMIMVCDAAKPESFPPAICEMPDPGSYGVVAGIGPYTTNALFIPNRRANLFILLPHEGKLPQELTEGLSHDFPLIRIIEREEDPEAPLMFLAFSVFEMDDESKNTDLIVSELVELHKDIMQVAQIVSAYYEQCKNQ